MNKERSTPVDRRLTAAHERIEELERERDGWKASAENRLEIQRQREERITELVGALDRISEGDIGRPHKVEKCAHEKYGFEHCEECYCDFARAALAKVRKP